MKKYFTFSDVHGNFTALDQSLKNAGFDANNEDHVLLGLGDYFDRGSQSKEVYEFLVKFQKLGRGFYLSGNHDEFFYEYLRGLDEGFYNFEYNGMWDTVKSFTGLKGSKDQAYVLNEFARDKINENYGVKNWVARLPYGFTLENYVFTHAGLKYDITKDSWVVDVWANTSIFVENFTEEENDLIYVFGHWHAFRLTGQFYKGHTSQKWTNAELEALTLEDFKTFKYKNFIGLDACTNYSNFVNVLVIESDAALQPFNKYEVKDYWPGDELLEKY